MMVYLIKEPKYIRLNVKERVIMAETLGDAISSFLYNSDRNTPHNKYVKRFLARTAAMVECKLHREQIHFVDMKKTGKLDENMRRECLIRIMELKEEFEDLRSRMISPARIDMDTEARRCVFRKIGDRNAAMTLMDFVRIYNKWVDVSAEYLILKALREISCATSGSDAATNPDKLATAQAALAEEYEQEISEKVNLLRSYCEDLCGIAEELDEEHGIFDILDKLTDEDAAIES